MINEMFLVLSKIIIYIALVGLLIVGIERFMDLVWEITFFFLKLFFKKKIHIKLSRANLTWQKLN